jgi:ATPase subunit of ABC transporter with duplicated ATPase domains
VAGPLLLGGQDLAKAYGTRTLFDGVSFGIFEGDGLCLVGPNGSASPPS